MSVPNAGIPSLVRSQQNGTAQEGVVRERNSGGTVNAIPNGPAYHRRDTGRATRRTDRAGACSPKSPTGLATFKEKSEISETYRVS